MGTRKVINGKSYDVRTAKPVCVKGHACTCIRLIKHENGTFSKSYIILYKKKTDEYFIAKYSANYPIDFIPYDIIPKDDDWASAFINKITEYGNCCKWVYDRGTKKSSWLRSDECLSNLQVEEAVNSEQPRVRIEQKFAVKCSYSTSRTNKEYSTLWMTYVCGPDYFRKKVRINNSCFNNIRCNVMDEWAFLRKTVGEKLDKKGPMTFKELKEYIDYTNHFSSDSWGDDMRSFVWYWEHSFEKAPDGRDRFQVIEDNYKSFKGSNYCIITSDPMEYKRNDNKVWKFVVESIGSDKAILHDNGKEFMRNIREREIVGAIVSLGNSRETRIKERVYCPDNWDPQEEFEKVLWEYEARYGEISNPEEIDLEKLAMVSDNRREMLRHLFY